MTVAPATAYDMPGVRAIANSYGNLHDWPDRPDYLDFELRERALWVAHEDGAVVGFAGVVRSVERTHLADLLVARERRGEGIGSRLLAAALPPEGLRTTLRGGRRARPAALRPRRAGAARAAALPRGHAPAGRAWRSACP